MLHPHAPRPDPELWRAVHERPAARVAPPVVRPLHRETTARALHGMPADRLAMAASWQASERPAPQRSA